MLTITNSYLHKPLKPMNNNAKSAQKSDSQVETSHQTEANTLPHWFIPTFMGKKIDVSSMTEEEQLTEIKNAGKQGVDYGLINVQSSYMRSTKDDKEYLILEYSGVEPKTNEKVPLFAISIDEEKNCLNNKIFYHSGNSIGAAVKAFSEDILPLYAEQLLANCGGDNVLATVDDKEVALAKLMGPAKYLSQKSDEQLLIENIADSGKNGKAYGPFTVTAEKKNDGYTLDYKLGKEPFVHLKWKFTGEIRRDCRLGDEMTSRYLQALAPKDLPFSTKIIRSESQASPDDPLNKVIAQEGAKHFETFLQHLNALSEQIKKHPEGLSFGDINLNPVKNKYNDEKQDLLFLYKDIPFLRARLKDEALDPNFVDVVSGYDVVNALVEKLPEDFPYKSDLVPSYMRKTLSAEEKTDLTNQFVQQKTQYKKLIENLKKAPNQTLSYGSFDVSLNTEKENFPKVIYKFKEHPICDVPLVDLEIPYVKETVSRKELLSLLAYDSPDTLPLKDELIEKVSYGRKKNPPHVPPDKIIQNIHGIQAELDKLSQTNTYGEIEVQAPEQNSNRYSFVYKGEPIYQLDVNASHTDFRMTPLSLTELVSIFEDHSTPDLPFKKEIYAKEDVSEADVKSILDLESTRRKNNQSLQSYGTILAKSIENTVKHLKEKEDKRFNMEKTFNGLADSIAIFRELMPWLDVPKVEYERLKTFALNGDSSNNPRASEFLELFIKREYCTRLLQSIEAIADKCPEGQAQTAFQEELNKAFEGVKYIGLDEQTSKTVKYFKDKYNIDFYTQNYPKLNNFFLEMVECLNISKLTVPKIINLHDFEGFKPFGGGVVALAGKDNLSFEPDYTIRDIQEGTTKSLWTTFRHEVGHISHRDTVDTEKRGFYDRLIPINLMNKDDLALVDKFIQTAKEKGLFETSDDEPKKDLNNLAEIKTYYLNKAIKENILPEAEMQKVAEAFKRLIVVYDGYLSLLKEPELNDFKDFVKVVDGNLTDVIKFAGASSNTDHVYGYFNGITATNKFIEEYLPQAEEQKLLSPEKISRMKDVQARLNKIEKLVDEALGFDIDITHAKRNLRELVAKTTENDNYTYYEPEYLDLVDSIGYPHPKDRVDLPVTTPNKP